VAKRNGTKEKATLRFGRYATTLRFSLSLARTQTRCAQTGVHSAHPCASPFGQSSIVRNGVPAVSSLNPMKAAMLGCIEGRVSQKSNSKTADSGSGVLTFNPLVLHRAPESFAE
jgi:hypothetical protein